MVPLAFYTNEVFVVVGSLVHCKMLSSIPSLCPLGFMASFIPNNDHQRYVQTPSNVSRGKEDSQWPPVEHHCLEAFAETFTERGRSNVLRQAHTSVL